MLNKTFFVTFKLRVHNIILGWPEYDHVQVDIELDMLSSVMVFHYGTLATKICLDPQLYYLLSTPAYITLVVKTAAPRYLCW